MAWKLLFSEVCYSTVFLSSVPYLNASEVSLVGENQNFKNEKSR